MYNKVIIFNYTLNMPPVFENLCAPPVKGDRSMPDSTKFLYLDPTEATPARECPSHCPCCEDSLNEIIAIIRDCGQDPVTQLSGYLITEDPTYLPEGANTQGNTARAIARRVGRDKLLTTLIELYLSSCTAAPSENV